MFQETLQRIAVQIYKNRIRDLPGWLAYVDAEPAELHARLKTSLTAMWETDRKKRITVHPVRKIRTTAYPAYAAPPKKYPLPNYTYWDIWPCLKRP